VEFLDDRIVNILIYNPVLDISPESSNKKYSYQLHFCRSISEIMISLTKTATDYKLIHIEPSTSVVKARPILHPAKKRHKVETMQAFWSTAEFVITK